MKKWVYIAIIVLLVCIDQLFKWLVLNNIETGKIIPVINGFFYLANTLNDGAAWGILKGGRIFFIAITIIITTVMFVVMLKSNSELLSFAFAVVIGGAYGNLIDRIFRNGYVIDFVELHFGWYIFPVFNFADSCVVIGTIIMGLILLFSKSEDEGVKSAN